MPVFDRLIELPLLKSIYMSFAALLGLLFVVACIVAILNFNWTSTAESPAEYLNGVAFGLSAFPYFVAVDGSGKVVARTSGEITTGQFAELAQSALSNR